MPNRSARRLYHLSLRLRPCKQRLEHLTSSSSIPDSSFCCWSSDDEVAELESLSAIFFKVQMPCKQRIQRPLKGLRVPRANPVTSQLTITRTQAPKICLLYLGQLIWEFRDPRISFKHFCRQFFGYFPIFGTQMDIFLWKNIRFIGTLNVSNHAHIWYVTWPQ